jgi:predicted acetylornithine/succinylornithine family transaminase
MGKVCLITEKLMYYNRMKKSEILRLYKNYVAPNYGRLPVAVVEGSGCKVRDADGREYLDFVSGIAVNLLGHSPAPVAKALTEQARRLVHTSNLFYTVPQGELARELVRLSFPSQALFVNSGAEAVESAIKLARKYHHDKKNGRFEIIAMENSFHGRTMGALSATGQKKYHKGFAPLLRGFRHVPFGDIGAVRKVCSKKTAAILVEPVQGEGGIVPAPAGYLRALRELCDRHGILLIYDEVQTGMGRTGKWFAWQNYGVRPDIMTLAKGLAGGFPIGAMLARRGVMAAFGPGTHASTFGGGPLACAAALAVIKTVKQKNLLQNVKKVSKEVKIMLNGLTQKFRQIRDVRCVGLMIGIDLEIPGGKIVADCLEEGMVINCTHDTVLRFLPPLNVKISEMKKGIKILEKVLCRNIS